MLTSVLSQFATQAQIHGTVDVQRSWLYSNEEHEVLERAAAILAVPVQDLPSLLPVTHSVSNDSEHETLLPLPFPQAYHTNVQPALTVNTSAASGNVNAVDNGLELADEELISPFSWHSDPVQNSQWSPEPAYHRVALERTTNTTVWDDLGAALGARGMVDAHYAPPYQECFDSMPNASLYGGATLVSPVHTTDFSESSHEEGNTTPELGNPGGSLDPTLAEGWAEFNWAGTTGIPQALSLGVPQKFNASSVDGKGWLDQLDGPAIVCYESGSSVTETYHTEEYGPQAFASEVPQTVPSQAISVSAERAFEGLPTQCQEAQKNGRGTTVANDLANQRTEDYPRYSDTALHGSAMPAPANSSRAEPISLQAPARYQHEAPVTGRIAKRRKPFRDPQKRAETGQTRKRGACARCRFQRVRVSPSFIEESYAFSNSFHLDSSALRPMMIWKESVVLAWNYPGRH